MASFWRGSAFREDAAKSPPTRLKSFSCNTIIIIDLIRLSPLYSPHYIPLSKQESIGPSRIFLDVTRSVKPWGPSAVRRRRSEQNRRIACDCRHLQPRPGPSHHSLTEQLLSDRLPERSAWSPASQASLGPTAIRQLAVVPRSNGFGAGSGRPPIRFPFLRNFAKGSTE